MTPGIARWRHPAVPYRPAESDAEAPPEPAEGDGIAERKRRVASLLAVNRPARPADPEGMGADTWRPWP